MPPNPLDKRRFVSVGSAEDPLAAQAWTERLQQLQIPSFTQPHPTSAVEALTAAGVQPWWELFALEEDAVRAAALWEETRAEGLAELEERMAAAEELAQLPPEGELPKR